MVAHAVAAHALELDELQVIVSATAKQSKDYGDDAMLDIAAREQLSVLAPIATKRDSVFVARESTGEIWLSVERNLRCHVGDSDDEGDFYELSPPRRFFSPPKASHEEADAANQKKNLPDFQEFVDFCSQQDVADRQHMHQELFNFIDVVTWGFF